jgi:hypothetical protein
VHWTSGQIQSLRSTAKAQEEHLLDTAVSAGSKDLACNSIIAEWRSNGMAVTVTNFRNRISKSSAARKQESLHKFTATTAEVVRYQTVT